MIPIRTNTLDIDGVISRLAKSEAPAGCRTNLQTPFSEIMEIIKRVSDKTLPEEYEETITNMANQLDTVLVENSIELKRADITEILQRKFPYKKYKEILTDSLKQLARNTKKMKVLEKKYEE
ncbi:MAG: hypothetical protein PHC66_01565 [Candidatus Nanoarchaeia archaeon]|nr:hypothetical protein [Candidatus Nanoarchaeia archaeon]MDD5239153.1 hypothetical protein [Candidatus Nanoarchaeia archaeon]